MDYATQDYAPQRINLEQRLRSLSVQRALRMADGAGRQISAIQMALASIKAGEYGYCRICGIDIAPDRLAHRPETVHCEVCSNS